MSKDWKRRSFAPVCLFREPGHFMSDWWLLKEKQERRQHPAALFLVNRTGCLSKSEIIGEEFKPFVSADFVSLDSRYSQVPII